MGGGGGFVGDLVSGIGDAIGGAVDTVGGVVNDIGSGIGNVVSGVGDAFAALDHAVGNIIPGGWATVGAAALMAYGIYDPELLASADAGTLTSAEVSNAGYDATTVASGVSSAASDAGFSSVAEFNAAADAGFTNAAEYTAATNAGFTNAAEYTAATDAGFTDAATFNAASSAGFTNAETYAAATNAGFTNAASYADATLNGFSDAATYEAAGNAGISNLADYNAAMDAGGFTNGTTFNTALNEGFRDAATYDTATSAGFNSAAQYETATGLGYTNASDYAAGQLGNFADAAEYNQATSLGYTNASDFSAGQLGGYANANDFTTASNLGYANNAQYQVGLQNGFANADEMMTAMTNAGFSDPITYGQALDAGFGAAGSSGAADWLTAQAAGIGDYAKYAQYLAAGLLIPQLIHPIAPGAQGGGIQFGYAGEAPWTWGSATSPVNPGTNPGWLAGNVQPFYNTSSPDQAQYYWGQHQPLQGANNVAGQWNNVPNAPATPWGAATSAVGGTEHLDINQFTQNMMGNPQYAASASGTTPGAVSTPGTPFVAHNPVATQPGVMNPTPVNPNAPVVPPAAGAVVNPNLILPVDGGPTTPINWEYGNNATGNGAIAPVPA